MANRYSYPISTADVSAWGPETTPEEMEILTDNLKELLQIAADTWFPGEIEVITTNKHWEPDSEDPRCVALSEYLAHHWVEKPLWEPDFDAAGYFAAHPCQFCGSEMKGLHTVAECQKARERGEKREVYQGTTGPCGNPNGSHYYMTEIPNVEKEGQ